MFTEAALGTLARTEAGLALVCKGSDMEASSAHGYCIVSRGELSLRSYNDITFMRPVALESPQKL